MSNSSQQLNYLENIIVQLPERRIFSRLGLNHHKSQVSSDELVKFKLLINSAFDCCETRGVWTVVPITSCNLESGKINFSANGNFELQSKKLAKLLINSSSAAFFSATVGSKVISERDLLIKNNKSSAALIYDAVGSEVVDEAMNFIQKIIAQNISRTSQKLTKMRFSAGYGDLDLSSQGFFYDLLNLAKFEIKLSDSFIMTPEKTVTALIGIEQ
ncbi:hypothetical protein AAEX28_08170 [Lentisphaerota bacterium WC36G]|nr:hypothetical protein LJT99_11025 [Lentisphaerae bacterium WC36]